PRAGGFACTPDGRPQRDGALRGRQRHVAWECELRWSCELLDAPSRAIPALQDRLLAEVARVLRPGGVFAGSDSVYSTFLRLLHVFDTMVLVDPQTFPKRLEAAGFVDAQVDTNPYAFRFRARKPA